MARRHDEGKCAWPRCRDREPAISWLGRPLCSRHWYMVCEMTERGENGYAEAYEKLHVPQTARTAYRGTRREPC